MMLRNRATFMKTMALVLPLLIASFVWAQDKEKRVKLQDLPAAVQKAIKEHSKDGKLRGLAEEKENGKTFYEAEMIVNGHSKDMLFDATGAVVEIEEELALNAVPAAVKTEIEKQAGKGKIVKVEAITKNNEIVYYEAALKSGGKTREIKISPAGKMLGK